MSTDQLLPLMYLLDSICKNHGDPFKELFQRNLVSNFAYVFGKVSEKVITTLTFFLGLRPTVLVFVCLRVGPEAEF